jgi:hypothetical protein
VTEPPTSADVRASDVERREVADALQRHYASGRLTQVELDARVDAAYAATTRDQLTELFADLPSESDDEPTTAGWQVANEVDPRLLCLLLCVFPPARLVYWLNSRHARSSPTVS